MYKNTKISKKRKNNKKQVKRQYGPPEVIMNKK